MSIANLFSPNDYNLFCKSITTSGLAPIDTNVIDTVNIGDQLQIGPVKAGSISISHVGALVNINETTSAPRFNAPTIGTAAPGAAMTVGANSTSMLLSSLGDIVIDRAPPLTPLESIFLGNTNTGKVVMSQVGGLPAVANAGITFPPGTATLNYYDVMPVISANVTGAIIASNYIVINATRINNEVILRWRPAGATTNATAAAGLLVTQTLPATFRPIGNVTAPCSVFGLNTVTYPGILSVSTAGVMQFNFMGGTHSPNNVNWVVTEPVNVTSGSIIYSII